MKWKYKEVNRMLKYGMGLMFMGCGTVLMLKSDLGVAAFDALCMGMSRIVNFSAGKCCMALGNIINPFTATFRFLFFIFTYLPFFYIRVYSFPVLYAVTCNFLPTYM